MKYAYQGREILPVVEIYHDVLPYLAGVSMRDFFLDAEQCAKAWEIGNQKLYETFGDELPLRKPTPAPLSYGHLICLGAPVTLPEDGEPNVRPFASSLDEGIEILKAKKGMDFTKNEMFQQYLHIWEYLKQRFPDASPDFSGFSFQGPLTTAVLMRGQDLLCDLYDEPEKAAEFIMLV
ncbi:MAG: hypothetical protein IJC25_06860, partial [Clostridia bacterium]|nr:hypothetical protein [Clostridia bacterium]